MFRFLALVTVALADHNSFRDILTVLNEATILIHTKTDMEILDFHILRDQIHILVDSITHNMGDLFDLAMGNLAQRSHISLAAMNSSISWPMDPLFIVPNDGRKKESYSDPSDLILCNTSLSRDDSWGLVKRDSFAELWNTISLYQKCKCEGPHIGNANLHPAECFTVTHKGVESNKIYNSRYYSMHLAFYDGNHCCENKKIAYHWQQPASMVCYGCIRTGDSLWWDWPGNNAP